MNNRYRAEGAEAEFEPGSRGRVLRNIVGILSARVMAQTESDALLVIQRRLVESFSSDHCFTTADICWMHREWLGGIYSWAGEYRNVNIAKGDFHFAVAARVPKLMEQFGQKHLALYTPCLAKNPDEIAMALAVVHAELVLIHPFREGNGRCARLLSLLMAFQAGLPPLDFGGMGGKVKRAYIGAIHSAVSSDYEPMAAIFRNVIRRTLRRYEKPGA